MARQTVVNLIDDLDGSKADETVRLSLDGKDYVLDLSSANAKKLRNALGPYIQKGARVPHNAPSATRRVGSGLTLREEHARNKAIRQWAEVKGLPVAPRGRISGDLQEQWRAAGSPSVAAVATMQAAPVIDQTATPVKAKSIAKKASPRAASPRGNVPGTSRRNTDRESVAARAGRRSSKSNT